MFLPNIWHQNGFQGNTRHNLMLSKQVAIVENKTHNAPMIEASLAPIVWCPVSQGPRLTLVLPSCHLWPHWWLLLERKKWPQNVGIKRGFAKMQCKYTGSVHFHKFKCGWEHITEQSLIWGETSPGPARPRPQQPMMAEVIWRRADRRLIVPQKVPSEFYPKVWNHREGPY